MVRLCSVFAREYAEAGVGGGLYSVGVHPRHVERGIWENDVATVRHALENPRVVAIGEAGLDGCCEAPMEVQRQAFEAQVRIAQERGVPLILHLVKALDECIAVLRHNALSKPFVHHGFRGSPEMAKQLMDWGGCISFGAALLAPSEKLKAAIRSVPVERLFLETDEADCGIDEVFAAAACIRGDEPDQLVRAVQSNARSLFHLPEHFYEEQA